MRLFELTSGESDYRFSPFVWRTKLALAHKGLETEAVATRFTDKSPFAASGSKTVPVIEDNGQWVSESWDIACYLEDSYPDAPSLFGGAMGRQQTRFINHWADRTVLMNLFPMLAADICALLEDEDAAYFRKTREERLGRSLEAAREGREERIVDLRRQLSPLRGAVKESAFVCGESPAYADYVCYTPFLWASCCSTFQVLEPDDPIAEWCARLADCFDGLARSAKRCA